MPVQTTEIVWTDVSANHWLACAKISEGCRNCWSESMALRFGRTPEEWTIDNIEANLQVYYEDFHEGLAEIEPSWVFTPSTSDPCLPWTEEVAYCPGETDEGEDCDATLWLDDADPHLYCEHCEWTGTPDELTNAREEWLEALWENDEHCYQVLTKWGAEEKGLPAPDLPDNAMLGVSCESPRRRYRIDWLREQDANMKFVSFEPLVEEITEVDLSGIDWIIVGGESHIDPEERREMDPQWPVRLYEAAREQDVAFLFKQHSGQHAEANRKLNVGDWRPRTFEAFPETPQGIPDQPVLEDDDDAE